MRFTGAKVLMPDGFVDTSIGVEGGRLVFPGSGREISVEGLWILPGIVDLHGDGFERHLSPRRGMVTDLATALPMVEAELAQNGITTAWLAQFWSWEGGMRGPEFAKKLAHALPRFDSSLDLRMQLRVERSMVEDVDQIRDLVVETGIDYLVFNDHLPHKALELGKTPPRLTGSALKAGRSPDVHLAVMQGLVGNSGRVADFVADLVGTLPCCFGSHDDPDAKTRTDWGALGLDIAEFPETIEAARAAKSQNHAVIMGAPNVLRGGSHKKNVSARELIVEGLVDALGSDYHYPAMIGAIFALHDYENLPIEQVWSLISHGPAQIMGLTCGVLDPGKRADFIILDPETRQVLGCFADGSPVMLRGQVARKLM